MAEDVSDTHSHSSTDQMDSARVTYVPRTGQKTGCMLVGYRRTHTVHTHNSQAVKSEIIFSVLSATVGCSLMNGRVLGTASSVCV